jgi:hypothetical protein
MGVTTPMMMSRLSMASWLVSENISTVPVYRRSLRMQNIGETIRTSISFNIGYMI